MRQKNRDLQKVDTSCLDREQRSRIHKLTALEREARLKGYRLVAGVDEAGRGPLAGPVFAAACMIPEEVVIAGIDDSKKLSPQKRCELFEVLTRHPKVQYGIGSVSSEEIDRSNILQATIAAMLKAVSHLACEPDYLLVDGLQLPHPKIPCRKVIRGDSLSYSIAAASILAKESRDRVMQEFHKRWPQYGFDTHKGYGTQAHREAIRKYGPCPIHRYTFEPVKSLCRTGG